MVKNYKEFVLKDIAEYHTNCEIHFLYIPVIGWIVGIIYFGFWLPIAYSNYLVTIKREKLRYCENCKKLIDV